jgi:RNA polymerase sigma-70 factor (ECF subfamily)
MGKARVLAVNKRESILSNAKTRKNQSFKNQVLFKKPVDFGINKDRKVFIIGLSTSPEKVIINIDENSQLINEEDKFNDTINYEEITEKNLITKNDTDITGPGTEFSEDEMQLSEKEMVRIKTEFEEEAVPHMSILRNFACKLLGNEFDADDLVQDTMTRAFRFYHQFEKGTNCKAWLFRIMKNLFINNYRKNQKQPGKVDYDEIENFIENIKSDKLDSNDLQEKVFANLFDDELTLALNSMQDDFKTVVILCDIEGLSYEEIADFVKCPIGTVRSRLHRGRKMLHKKLTSYARRKGYEVSKNVNNYLYS